MQMDKASQKAKILDYCKRNGSITVRDAFEKLHINSPTKRISELRQAGYKVDSAEEVRLDNLGNVQSRYKRYFISEVDNG
jgi:hypothetical protein